MKNQKELLEQNQKNIEELLKNKSKVCAIIGQKLITTPKDLYAHVESALNTLIYIHGYRIFLFGKSNEFEKMCLQILNKYQDLFPDIKKIFVVPFEAYLDNERLPLDICTRDFDEKIYLNSLAETRELSFLNRNYGMLVYSRFALLYAAAVERSYAYYSLNFCLEHQIPFANLYEFEEDEELQRQTGFFD